MTRTIIAAGAAFLAFSTPAFARDGEQTFKREGVTYTYTASQQDDARVLEGTAEKGRSFRLVVKNGWVDGYVGQSRVSFRAPKAKPILVAQR